MTSHCLETTRSTGRGGAVKALCLPVQSNLPFHPTSQPCPTSYGNCRPLLSLPVPAPPSGVRHSVCICGVSTVPSAMSWAPFSHLPFSKYHQSLRVWLKGRLTHEATIPQLEVLSPSSDHPTSSKHLPSLPVVWVNAPSPTCLNSTLRVKVVVEGELTTPIAWKWTTCLPVTCRR